MCDLGSINYLVTCGKLDADDVAVRRVSLSGEARLDWPIENQG